MKRPLIAAALAFSLLATPAFAASSYPIEVEFNRANLDTAEGAAAEYEAVREKIEASCKAENAGIGFLADTCTKRAMKEAVRKIDNPNLSTVHAQKS